jgi:hypothetical protein
VRLAYRWSSSVPSLFLLRSEAGASAKFPGSGGAVVGVVDVAGTPSVNCIWLGRVITTNPAGIASKGRLPEHAPPPTDGPDALANEAATAARVTAATEAVSPLHCNLQEW